jgi:glyoxylase I family protein
VAMASTSDYWRLPFHLLEDRFETWLVNAHDVKHLPGRPRTDRLDAVWPCKVAERQMLVPQLLPPPAVRPVAVPVTLHPRETTPGEELRPVAGQDPIIPCCPLAIGRLSPSIGNALPQQQQQQSGPRGVRRDMTDTVQERPDIQGFSHFSITATNPDASVEWYQRVLGLQPLPMRFPHHGAEESGYAIVLMEPNQGWGVGIHHNAANPGTPADETATGLDHFSLAVANRGDLDVWAAWLDRLGVTHAGVTDTTDPIPYSVLVFRDPDNIQLELIYMPS